MAYLTVCHEEAEVVAEEEVSQNVNWGLFCIQIGFF